MDAQDKAAFDQAHARLVSLEGSGWEHFLKGVEKIGAAALPILETVLDEVVPGLKGNPLAGVVEAEVNKLVDKLASDPGT